MLRSANKFLYNKHIEKHGCIGVYCDRHEISLLHLVSHHGQWVTGNSVMLKIDNVDDYGQQLSNLLERYNHHPIPICIGISQHECSYDVMAMASLPKNQKAHETFIRWRYEKHFGKKAASGILPFAQLSEAGDKSFVAVSSGGELLNKIITVAVSSSAAIQMLVPVVTAYPKFLAAIASGCVDYSIVLRLDSRGWFLAFIGKDEVIFCRYHNWLKDPDLSLECLKKDIERTSEYFSHLLGVNRDFPLCIIGDDAHFKNVEQVLEQKNRPNVWYKSVNSLPGNEAGGGEEISIDAMAVATAGLKLYD